MFGRFKELLYICIVKYVIMANDEDLLVKILKHSHEQIMSGKSYSQDEVERFLDQRLYEFRDKMVGTCVAEPC